MAQLKAEQQAMDLESLTNNKKKAKVKPLRVGITAAQRTINKVTGIAGATRRRIESNKIKKQMKNTARRKSAGGQGG